MKKAFILIVACLNSVISFAQKNDTITTVSGLKYFFVKKGNGPALIPGKLAIWDYKLTLADGKKIDATADRGSPFAVQYAPKRIIAGVYEALSLMHVGDRGIFILPSALGYGDKGWGTAIPPKATLIFDMDLLAMKDKSLQMVLDSVLFAKPVTKDSKPQVKLVMDTYEGLKKQNFKNVYVSEDDFNTLGYEIMEKFPKDALEFFKLNVALYPKSSNVYDSLGDGYKAVGDNQLAIENYEKSLKLNPDNTNAKEMIKKLAGK